MIEIRRAIEEKRLKLAKLKAKKIFQFNKNVVPKKRPELLNLNRDWVKLKCIFQSLDSCILR